MEAVERFLCLASSVKGHDFLRQCAEMGVRPTVLTLDRHRDGEWPREVLEDLATMPAGLNPEQILNTVSWMVRGRRFNRIVALDEADLETAAQIREHMRIPGMGVSTAGCYRDRLAMRVIARAFGYLVPEFCRVLNYDDLREYMSRVPAPWLLKPRRAVPSMETHSIDDQEQLWRTLDVLGDVQSRYLLEQFIAGDRFYVDSIIDGGEVKFSVAHQSGHPSAQLTQEGCVAITRTVDRASREWQMLTTINQGLAPALGMVRGITHAEFVRSYTDGRFRLLEIAAGVAGAFTAELVQTASGINLWREWARLEVSDLRRESYAVPEHFAGYAGSVLCLTQAEEPDTDAFDNPAIAMCVGKDGHAGLIVQAATTERLQQLLDDYSIEFQQGIAPDGRVVSSVGIEPTTHALKGRCSTD